MSDEKRLNTEREQIIRSWAPHLSPIIGEVLAMLDAERERVRALETALQWALDIIESGQRPAIDFSGKSGYFAQYKALLAQSDARDGKFTQHP